MKKLILFIVCNFICIYICTAEPMYFLLGQSNINVEFNYEHTKLVSISYQNFIALKNAVGVEWENLFLEELNDELEDEDMIFGDFPESPYLMLCHVVSISDNGTIRLDIRFINTNTLEERMKLVITGRGGMYGSFSNLIGDGMSRCGENLGDYIDEHLDL